MNTRLRSILGLLIFYPMSVTMAAIDSRTIERTVAELRSKYPSADQTRLVKGMQQVADLWREVDGTETDFSAFCTEYFIADPMQLEQTFQRLQSNLEIIGGHNVQVARDLASPLQLELGPVLPVDYLFAEYDPAAHVREDFFKTKIAFVTLLNFPATTLQERLQLGKNWTRVQWAQARLGQRFLERIPADVQQALTKANVQADDYISNYNIFMHNLTDNQGQHPFPPGLKLISHWGLRDELKAQYAAADGLPRQRMIQQLMERIIRQEIPQRVINSEQTDWNPFKRDDASPEPDTRYSRLLSVFKAERQADVFYPRLPSKIVRRFELDREIPEADFARMLVSVLTDPAAKQVATLISRRLKRKLEPFDIWYNGFKPKASNNEADLDKIVMAKYPDTAAFQADLVSILSQLDFAPARARYLAEKITVDPSRGVGHALGAGRRDDNAHLRTRIPHDGMRYKGYNIAIHELGHCVEQVFSLNGIDHTLLAGVPNTAFTEAFAFVFQSRDLALLGMAQSDPLQEDLRSLDVYWATCEIAAVGLVDMKIWHWMYDHPQATPAELKAAVLQIACEVWNCYFASLIGCKDSPILAIYSHIVDAGLYLPDYSLGHIISFQLEKYLEGKKLGTEMERMCVLGAITPEAWMQQAIGAPVSPEPLLRAVAIALKNVK
jgi:hypothetical protein